MENKKQVASMDRVLKDTFNQLPDTLRRHCLIAGGAAVDAAKATDIDVYVMKYLGIENDEDRKEAIRNAFGKFSPATLTYEVQKSAEEDISFSCAPEPEYGPGKSVVIELAARSGGKKIQIIDTTETTPGAVLRDFDLSTHAIAWDQYGALYERERYARLEESPRLGPIHDPAATWGRYRKICLRYGLPLNIETLVLLFHSKGK